MGKIYEMLWDCGQCGSTKLLGKSHRHCPSCGAPQDPKGRYFPSESEKIAVTDHVYHGVDLYCAHCTTPNSAKAQHCVNCGAPIGDGDDEAVDLIPSQPANQNFQYQAKPPWEGFDDEEETEESSSLSGPLGAIKALFTKRKALVLGVACLVACGVLGFLVVEYWTYEGTLETTGHAWERSIKIERFTAKSESSWCDGMPSDAYSVSRSSRKRSTNRIKTGENCTTQNVDRGDGTFSQEQVCTPTYREEDVYDDWCSYTVDRWVYERSSDSAGSGVDPPPYWPSVSINECASLGCERIGGRTQTYTVYYKEEGAGRSQDCDFGQSRWAATKVGSRWSGDIRVITKSVRCSTLKAIGR